MSGIKDVLELLDGWSEGRRPTTRDTRHMIGSWAAKAMVSFFVFEWVVQLAWNKGDSSYDYFTNYVSDLGATKCQGEGKPLRQVCSPPFVAMDLELVFIGVSVIVAACLITSPVLWLAAHPGDIRNEYLKWLAKDPDRKKTPRIRPGAFARFMTIAIRLVMAVIGVCITIIGVIPEDFKPTFHDYTVRVLVCCICLLLLLMGISWFRRTNWALLFIALTIISVYSAITLGLANGTSPVSGLWERGVIYSFIIGLATLGIKISYGAHKERERSLEASRKPWAEQARVKMSRGLKPRVAAAEVMDGDTPKQDDFAKAADDPAD